MGKDLKGSMAKKGNVEIQKEISLGEEDSNVATMLYYFNMILA